MPGNGIPTPCKRCGELTWEPYCTTCDKEMEKEQVDAIIAPKIAALPPKVRKAYDKAKEAYILTKSSRPWTGQRRKHGGRTPGATSYPGPYADDILVEAVGHEQSIALCELLVTDVEGLYQGFESDGYRRMAFAMILQALQGLQEPPPKPHPDAGRWNYSWGLWFSRVSCEIRWLRDKSRSGPWFAIAGLDREKIVDDLARRKLLDIPKVPARIQEWRVSKQERGRA